MSISRSLILTAPVVRLRIAASTAFHRLLFAFRLLGSISMLWRRLMPRAGPIYGIADWAEGGSSLMPKVAFLLVVVAVMLAGLRYRHQKTVQRDF